MTEDKMIKRKNKAPCFRTWFNRVAVGGAAALAVIAGLYVLPSNKKAGWEYHTKNQLSLIADELNSTHYNQVTGYPDELPPGYDRMKDLFNREKDGDGKAKPYGYFARGDIAAIWSCAKDGDNDTKGLVERLRNGEITEEEFKNSLKHYEINMKNGKKNGDWIVFMQNGEAKKQYW